MTNTTKDLLWWCCFYEANLRKAPSGRELGNKKPSPVGEGGSRRLTDEESFLFIVNTSSTAYAVPLPPLGKAI